MTHRMLLTPVSLFALCVSMTATAYASSRAQVRVHCIGDDGKVKKATVLAARGTITPIKPGVATIDGLKPGGQVLVECRSGDRTTRVRHRVTTGKQTVYLTIGTSKVKTTTPAPTRSTTGPKGLCTLQVNATPWAKCSVAGKSPRTTRFETQLKGAKSYDVTCVRGGRQKTKTFTCQAGQSHKLHFKMN